MNGEKTKVNFLYASASVGNTIALVNIMAELNDYSNYVAVSEETGSILALLLHDLKYLLDVLNLIKVSFSWFPGDWLRNLFLSVDDFSYL